MLEKKWELTNQDNLVVTKMVEELGISIITARCLINRGLKTNESVQAFLNLDLDLECWDPFLLDGMKEAVGRLITALLQGEKIVIFGDYDVDGITGTSLLVRVLKQIGANVDYYIPSREEGYGLNLESIQRLALSEYSVLVTIDNGISSYQEVELAKSLGIDVIITDHHEPPDVIPLACAVINPKLKSCNYPCSFLSGVGVGFKLCQALAIKLDSEELTGYINEQLDLVALGTIADIVPLLEENRAIAAQGLKKIKDTVNPGLIELLKITKLMGKEINSGHVGFVLGPRINAIGRLGDPMLGVELFTTNDPIRAAELANQLEVANRKRQMIEEIILNQAIEMIEQDQLYQDYGIVLASKDWHPGIIGIVASKLVERYYRPIVLIAIQNEMGKASARSIRGLNLYKALTECSIHLKGYGGHAMAAGLTIEPEQISLFTEAFQQTVKALLSPDELIPSLKLDAEVDGKDLSPALLQELEQLEPHGIGNPRPHFSIYKVRHEHRLVGANNQHLKLWVFAQENKIDAIGFSMAKRVRDLQENLHIDLAFTLNRNVWQGRESLQMVLSDISPTKKSFVDKLFEKTFGNGLDLKECIPIESNTKKDMLQYKSIEDFYHELKQTNFLFSQVHDKTLKHLLDGKNILHVSGIESLILITFLSYALHHAKTFNKISCFFYPLVSQVDQAYQPIKDFLQPFGVNVLKATGTSDDFGRLEEAIRNQNLVILLLTPEYFENHLDKFKILQKRVSFLVFNDPLQITFNPELQDDNLVKLNRIISFFENPQIFTHSLWASHEQMNEISTLLGIEEIINDCISAKPIKVIDQRNNSLKDAYLSKLIQRREKTVILVNNSEVSVKIAQKLRKILSDMEDQIVYYNSSLAQNVRKKITELFYQGELRVIVTTGILLKEVLISDIRNIVFYDVVDNLLNFYQLSALAGFNDAGGKIHLLFGEHDQKQGQITVNSLAPDRDLLAKVYILLQQLANKDNQIYLDKQLLDKLNGIGFIGDLPKLLSSALSIFTELGLIEVVKIKAKDAIILLPRPTTKLDLNSSIRYNEGNAVKKAFDFCSEILFNKSKEKIQEMINSFLCSNYPEIKEAENL